VWTLGNEPDGSAASELTSHYTYESIKALDVDWPSARAALGARSGTISLYNLETGRKLGTFKGHSDEVMCVRLQSADSGVLLSGSKDGTVRVWDVRTGSNKAPMVLRGPG
jgi:WD40 repeat protein